MAIQSFIHLLLSLPSNNRSTLHKSSYISEKMDLMPNLEEINNSILNTNLLRVSTIQQDRYMKSGADSSKKLRPMVQK